MFADSSVVVLLTLGAYLVGSLSFAVIVSRLMGLDDPRTYGSQNPGATNVLRSGNKQAAVATLLFDALKGYFPVLLVKLYGPTFGLDDRAVALVAISAFIGHLWPVFFAFKGGKGVATAAGILFGVEPLLGAAVMGTWLIVAFFFRYSSLAALAASLFAPAYYLFGNQIAWQTSDAELLAVAVMSALLLMRHKDNIARLVSGQETKIGAKKDAS
ncbi:glycerol-3-phosphate acyltransferase [Limnohabitans sp. Rim8]|jgi:glycerol-3-phosphate acyltransferase PlsY|uniref:Glycerol-3-phosphate acyltransferase n=1 Tax=Limnohabitans curvus TaxID=323423 RepID=A0A315EVP1_9BURK|nr:MULTISPECIES: glycerol-3-phosphate 1-O-acyltransferase PlsY [Limnohabitans]PUE57724.1 glycerol-3-phosphate acyltransferase [Limnohabitans sp. Rim8]PUE60014.1 glycerol-3-phosphate acyltransferase [Limnohabitans curvus]